MKTQLIRIPDLWVSGSDSSLGVCLLFIVIVMRVQTQVVVPMHDPIRTFHRADCE